MADTAEKPQDKYRIPLKRAAVDVKRLPDGSLILRSPYDLPEPANDIGVWLRRWAKEDPNRLFMAKLHRSDTTTPSWEEITYGNALNQVRAIAQALAKRDLSPDRPVLILSKNGIQNALLQLAAMDIGVPAIHINPALALDPNQLDSFKHVLDQTSPGLVFAAEGKPFEVALHYAAEQEAEVLLGDMPIKGLKSTNFKKFTKAWRKSAAKKARALVTPDTTAKVHFTGTSPNEMTAIVTSQATMCANHEALAQVIPALTTRPPIIVDDAPWHRAGSGNLVLNAVLRNGGTLYIDRFGLDEGDDVSLVSPSPSIHITELVPLYGLISRLEENVLLRKTFFRNLDLIWIVSGMITAEAEAKLQNLAVEQINCQIPILTSLTGTGTSAVNTARYFATDESNYLEGNIGLPLPGTYLKLEKTDDIENSFFELKVKGFDANGGPALWHEGRVSQAETDEDGFYAINETVRLIDEMRPFKGIERISRVD